MSYSFGMFFTECTPDKVVSTCNSVVKTIVDNPIELIANNIENIPTIKFKDKTEDYITRSFDIAYLYQLFNFPFVYWKQYNLLALRGYFYGTEVEKLFKKHVCFQNSTDQDYDYDVWSGIVDFDIAIWKAKSTSNDELIKKYKEEFGDDEEPEDIEYYRRTYLYDMIYKSLDLDNWLYGADGKFERITINGIPNIETQIKLYSELIDIINRVSK